MKFDIPLSLAESLYNNSNTNESLRKILSEKFINTTYSKFDYKNIKTYEDACDYLGYVEIYGVDDVYYKLYIISKALNENWEYDYKSNHIGYYHIFKLIDNKIKFIGISNDDSTRLKTGLYFKSYDLAMYAKDNFFDLYEKYYYNVFSTSGKLLKTFNEINGTYINNMVPDIESNFYIKQDKFITNVVIKAYNSCHDIIKLIKEYHNQILINNSSGVNYNGIISLVDEEYNSDEIENILISGKKIILYNLDYINYNIPEVKFLCKVIT